MKMKTIATPLYLSHYDLEGEVDAIIDHVSDTFKRAKEWALTQFPWLISGQYSLYADWEPPTFGGGETLTIYLKRPETIEETMEREELQKLNGEERTARDLDVLNHLVKMYPEAALKLITQ